MNLFYHYFILFGIIFSVILALGQLAVKNRKLNNYILAALFLCIAIAMTKGVSRIFLETNQYYQLNSFILIADITALTCVGPLFYLYIHTQIIDNFKFRQKHLLPFSFSFAILTFLIIYYVKNGFILLNKDISLYIKASVFYIFSYEIIVLIILIKYTIEKKLKNKRSALFCYIITISAIIQSILWYLRYWQLGFILVSVIFICIYILSHRNPVYLQLAANNVKTTQYQKSQINSIDIKSITKKLYLIVEQEKLYTDENINLEKIAKMLNITNHQLSELLNRHIKKSFIQFINEYRIKDSQKLLLDEPDSSILSICYQVGFNSNSAFYNAFKKINGMNPKQYRKKYL